MNCCRCRTFGFVVLSLSLGMNSQVRASQLEVWSVSSSLGPGHLSSEWVATDNLLTTLAAKAQEPAEVFSTLPMEFSRPQVGDFSLSGNNGASPWIISTQFPNSDPNDNAARLVSGNRSGGNTGGSEWDYLWENSSRVPVGSIPEPTSAALLVGGVVLMWAGRNRKRTD